MEKRFFNIWRSGLIVVFALSILMYLPSLMGTPIWDDPGLISGEQFGGNTFTAAFTHPFGNYYRPLTSASFVFDSSYARAIPLFYHQTNILLHAATAVLVCLIAFQVSKNRWAGLLAGTFFIFQPFQVGAAAWIGGRTDVLSCFFLSLFLATFISYCESWRKPMLWLSLVSFFLAALSKEQSIAVLPVVPLGLLVFGQKKGRELAKLSVPYVMVLAVYIGLWLTWAPIPRGAPNSFIQTVTLALRTGSFYGLGLVAPNRASLVTYTLENNSGPGWILAGFVMAIGLAGVLVWTYKKQPKWFVLVAFGLLIYIPISNFPTLPSMVVASYRFSESGIAAACLLGVLGALCFEQRRIWLSLALASNLLLGALVTWWGVHQYDTPVSFFEQVANADPHFIVGVQFYSQFLDNAGKHDEAIARTGTTLEWVFGTEQWLALLEQQGKRAITPDVKSRLQANIGLPNLQTLGNFVGSRASYLARANKAIEARRTAKAALALAPNDPWVNYLYGRLIYPVDKADAIRHWEMTLRISPGYAACAISLAHERLRESKYAEAIRLLTGALQQVDYSGNTWIDLADAKLGVNDFSGAAQALKSASSAMFPPDIREIEKRTRLIEVKKKASGNQLSPKF